MTEEYERARARLNNIYDPAWNGTFTQAAARFSDTLERIFVKPLLLILPRVLNWLTRQIERLP